LRGTTHKFQKKGEETIVHPTKPKKCGQIRFQHRKKKKYRDERMPCWERRDSLTKISWGKKENQGGRPA